MYSTLCDGIIAFHEMLISDKKFLQYKIEQQKDTKAVIQLQTIENLISEHTDLYLTAKQIAEELEQLYERR